MKKLTDNEIVKALEFCANSNNTCDKCVLYVANDDNCECSRKLKLEAVKLINRQKAENERLQTEVKLLTEKSITAKYPHCVLCGNGAILTKSLEEYDKLIADISDEAYKEFAERLKEKRKIVGDNQLCDSDIDEVLTEIQK